MTMVAGTVVAQYNHSLSDTCQDPSSLKLKKVVLNRAYCRVKRSKLREGGKTYRDEGGREEDHGQQRDGLHDTVVLASEVVECLLRVSSRTG